MRFTTLSALVALFVIPSAVAAVPSKDNGVFLDAVIPDKWIVKYKPNIDPAKQKKHEADIQSRAKNASMRGLVDRFDIAGLHGYIVELPHSYIKNLSGSGLIDYIERDSVVRTAAVAASRKPDKRAMVTQYHAPWGLGRISHRAPNRQDYYYSDTAGSGVRVYVLDTGIRTSHNEFSGRAVWGTNFVPNTPNIDEDGHGTHVAGTIAGETFGVAKKATVVAVKVLDKTGSGYMSGLLQGLNWAVDDAKHRGIAHKAVINMSLGGAYTASVNEGVRAATDAGITVVVAAGNDNDTAASYSPASAPTALTVGASDEADMRADFSNWGGEVDIFAPGVATLSADNESDSAEKGMSGTSMASPHVAGLAAYFIAREDLSGYAAVTKRILDAATTGVGDRKGSADRLAYNAHGR